MGVNKGERLSEYRTEERNAYFGKSLVRLACIEEKNRNQKTEHKSEQPQNSEKNMIVKFRSKTFYMTSAKVLNTRKKNGRVTKSKKTGRTSDCES